MVLVILFSILGAFVTYELSKISKMGAIRASALASLIFALLAPLVFNEGDSERLSAIFFGGSFVGMTSIAHLKRFGILWSGLVFGLIYWPLDYFVYGMGGALGLSAFIAVSITLIKQKGLTKLAQR